MSDLEFLKTLERVIAQRLAEPSERSYTAKLAGRGVSKVAQKVGEEGVELALAAVGESDERVVDEAADLLYHLLVLLKLRGLSLGEVVGALESRHRKKGSEPF
jgi:phosphoribosyl-ATP pyrophosphohydrolase/phosphoribosyl-AMP cyclohydrolase